MRQTRIRMAAACSLTMLNTVAILQGCTLLIAVVNAASTISTPLIDVTLNGDAEEANITYTNVGPMEDTRSWRIVVTPELYQGKAVFSYKVSFMNVTSAYEYSCEGGESVTLLQEHNVLTGTWTAPVKLCRHTTFESMTKYHDNIGIYYDLDVFRTVLYTTDQLLLTFNSKTTGSGFSMTFKTCKQ